MEMVRHKTLGMGEVVGREVENGFTYLYVRYESGEQVKLAIPYSFQTGAVEALGTLKDEVEQAIAERKARLAAPAAPAAVPAAPARKAAAKPMPTGPIPSAFEQYLIREGYSVETDSGSPSTVYSYLNAVEAIRVEEGLSWDALKANISAVLPRYDVGGDRELMGAKSNKTYINALKRFAEFIGKP